MSYDVAEIKRDHPLADVVARHVRLTRDGREWRGLCPFHKERTPSFTVMPDRGRYHCFGCGAHGDVIEFVAQLHQVDFRQACAILAGADASRAPVPEPAGELRDSADLYAGLIPQPVPDRLIPVPHAPLRAWNPKRQRWTYYRPSMVFPYRDASGACLGVVLRIDLRAGEKITPTLRYVQLPDTGELAWSHMPFDKPRPLYGLDLLATSSSQVIVVEGEKAADAARRLLPELTVVTWPGGGKAIGHVEWRPLAGRSVVIWGDADAEGWATVTGRHDEERRKRWPGVAELAHRAGADPIKVIPWDQTLPKGWDAADAEAEGWDREQTLTWLRARAQPWDQPPPPPPAEAPTAGGNVVSLAEHRRRPVPPPEAPTGGSDEPREPAPAEEEPFRILGFNNGIYYYQPRGTQQIVALSANAHTVANLCALAPVEHWETYFPTRTERAKFDLTYATNALMRRAERIGIFTPARVRGRGAWLDAGRPVMHLGDVVYVAGQPMQPARVPSRYIYQQGEPLDIGNAEPATSEEAYRLVEIAHRLAWENRLSADLLAGWCAVAPVCGALRWRSHIWITGPAGSGKSTVLDDIVGRVVGSVALRRDGTTTEANLRQTLRHDALPVIFDEAESNDRQEAQRIQNVIALARVASSGGAIGRGSANGEPMEYVMRSCFCFSSINTAIVHYADDTRISRLVLRRNEAPDADAQYQQLRADISQWFDAGYAARMFARSVRYLDVLIDNAATFTDAATIHLRNRRAGDQIGVMLAGLYLCHRTDRISFERALEWIASRDWTDHAALEADRDERRLLTRLATTRRRMAAAGGAQDFTIGELVLIAAGKVEDAPVTRSEAARELGRIGIKYTIGDDGPAFIVANRSPELERILEGTPWARDWKRPLRSLPGAEQTAAHYFGPGLTERGTLLPLTLLEP